MFANALLAKSYKIIQDTENKKGKRSYTIIHGSGESVCKATETGSLL